MPIEQIIEFEWREPGKLAVHVLLPITAYFHGTTKISKKIFLSRLSFTAKTLQ